MSQGTTTTHALFINKSNASRCDAIQQLPVNITVSDSKIWIANGVLRHFSNSSSAMRKISVWFLAISTDFKSGSISTTS